MISVSNWFFWALLSAVFAALTAIFAKVGLQGVDSDLATLVRTFVIMAVLIVFVHVTSHFEGEERVVRRFQVVPYNIPRRCAATYYPETNVLVSVRSVADRSNQPASKSVRITLMPSASQHVEVTGR